MDRGLNLDHVELGSGEGVTLLGPTQAAFNEVEVEDITAAKHDDAEVDEVQWDVQSFRLQRVQLRQ